MFDESQATARSRAKLRGSSAFKANIMALRQRMATKHDARVSCETSDPPDAHGLQQTFAASGVRFSAATANEVFAALRSDCLTRAKVAPRARIESAPRRFPMVCMRAACSFARVFRVQLVRDKTLISRASACG